MTIKNIKKMLSTFHDDTEILISTDNKGTHLHACHAFTEEVEYEKNGQQIKSVVLFPVDSVYIEVINQKL